MTSKGFKEACLKKKEEYALGDMDFTSSFPTGLLSSCGGVTDSSYLEFCCHSDKWEWRSHQT